MPPKIFLLIVCSVFFFACNKDQASIKIESVSTKVKLTLEEANRLSSLPLKCIQNPLPYKSGHILDKKEDQDMPINHHPSFYGCFDWHSAVHGHWSLIYLLKEFPQLDSMERTRKMIDENLSPENILKELDYFSMNRYTKSFERTYGWAWLLKLAEELHTWDDPQAQIWYQNLLPLTNYICESYITYLPKLVYPIRVGEHSNTAFGLSFAYDYAVTVGHDSLMAMIENSALRFYEDDQDCPIAWEPSGYDFLSPCLQEVDIMRKVLSSVDFEEWLNSFLPSLEAQTLVLKPGEIRDRSDGKLVHLDGLNFSRAWCLYPLDSDRYPLALEIANEHLDHSLTNIKDGDYSGEHWLASFALYAFKSAQ